MGKKSRMLAINFLLDQCFFDVGSLTFHQAIGIPVGSPPALFMANLFLFTYEFKWVLDTNNSNLQKARIFANTFRLKYDLFAANDNSEFEKSSKEIYPPELVLKKENIAYLRASFLDLEIDYHSLNKNAK